LRFQFLSTARPEVVDTTGPQLLMESAQETGQEDFLRRLSANDNLMLGVATGVVEQGLSQPLLYWKNSFQQGLPFTANPRLMYRGMFASVSNMATLTGLQFVSSGFLQKVVSGDAGGKMTWSQEVLCAFMGGAMSGPVCCTLELTMIQQQRFGGSFAGTLQRIVQTSGPQGLTRGLFASTGREAFYTAGYLGIVPATQTYFKENTSLNPWVGNFVGAAGGGLICAALSQPLDTAKTCMQGDLEGKKYGNTLATLRTLHKEYGSVTAMYRGYWWRAVYIVFDFIALDFLAKKMAPIMFPDKINR